MQRCSGWHAGIKDSAKAGRSMNRLCTAIHTQPQHRPVSNLTDEQVLLIVIALRESEEKQPGPEKDL
ncbi:MAG: hypothetical protein HGA43_03425 [Nitrospirae bacterium]|nr:hypothetical protein [Nitrospirota bacterium]